MRFVLAMLFAVAANDPSRASEGKFQSSGCGRYDRFDADTILLGMDPTAIVCLTEGGTPSLISKFDSFSESKKALAQLLLLQMGGSGDATDSIVQWLHHHPTAGVDEIKQVLRALGYAYTQQQQLRRANALGAALKSEDLTAASALRWIDGAESLPDQQNVALSGDAGFRSKLDFGTSREGFVHGEVSGKKVDVFFDSGASGSFVSEARANELGFRFFGEETVAVSTLAGAARLRMAAAPPIKIGGTTLNNVIFLVTPNNDTYRGYGRGITLGTPVMRMFGKVAWLKGGAEFAAGDKAPDVACLSEPNPLFQYQGYVGLIGGLPQGAAPAFFDSRFLFTFLNRSTVATYAPEIRLRSKTKYASEIETDGKRKISTVGAPRFRMRVGEADIALKDVRAIFPIETGPIGFVAQIGMDMVKQTGAFVYDFGAMTYAAVGRNDPQLAACMPG